MPDRSSPSAGAAGAGAGAVCAAFCAARSSWASRSGEPVDGAGEAGGFLYGKHKESEQNAYQQGYQAGQQSR